MRRLSALIIFSLMATTLALVAPTRTSAAGASSGGPVDEQGFAVAAMTQEQWHDPGHSFEVNGAGAGVIMAIKSDGDMYIRRVSASGAMGSWVKLGSGDWASGDVAIDETGRVEVIGVKLSGHMFTRSWTGSGVWGPWTKHGAATWDLDAPPAITTSGSQITYGAVKADGRLYTRQRNATGNVAWGSYTRHGRVDWAQVDIDAAPNGSVWLIGTKDGGHLYTRAKSGSSWGGFSSHGAPTWDSTTAPSIALRNGAAVFAAVKADGRLYTRTHNGSWSNFVRQGADEWTGVSVDMSATGVIGLAATKSSGRLYTRVLQSGNWGSWVTQGSDTWSVSVDPAISVGNDRAHVLGVKASGALYSRSQTGSSWAAFSSQGTDWESGEAGSEPPPPAEETDRITIRIVRFRAIEDCDAGLNAGEFTFKATAHAGTTYLNTPTQIGNAVDHTAKLHGRGVDSVNLDTYSNVPKLFTFELPRVSDPKPPRFGVVFRAWERDGTPFDSRMNGAFTTSWHTYQPATETWDHPPQPATGLGGTWPTAYIARIGAIGSGCVVDLHYKVYINDVEVTQG